MAASPGERLLLGYLREEWRRLAALTAVLIVTKLLPVAAPLLLAQLVDGALAGRPVADLVGSAALFLGILLASDVLSIGLTWASVRLAWLMSNRIRSDLVRHALRLDLTWHGEHSPGQLIERVDGDVSAVGSFAATAVVRLGGNAILVVGVLVASFTIDVLAGLLLGLTVVVATLIMRRLRALAVPAYDHERTVLADLYGDVEERLGGLEDLRANGAAVHVMRRLQSNSSRWWHAARRASWRGEGAFVAAAASFAAGGVVVLGTSIWLGLSLGSVLALLRFSQMLADPLSEIAEQLTEFQRAVAGARRAGRLLQTVPRIGDGPGRGLPPGPLDVALEDVQFCYPDEPDRIVLGQVDLRVAAGRRVGVVGRSGSGKTSFGRLLTRMFDVTAGTVRLGGVDVRDVDGQVLRRRVGVISQQVQILRATVRDNLTLYGAVTADDDALRRALDDVGMGEWLDALPNGLDHGLDADEEISAGQAQLLAFARVLLTDPGLVVMDEATSRLDPHTETMLSAAANRVLAGRTVVVIAHRMQTLDGVDEVVVIDAGQIVEHGDRDALVADPTSRFARLRAVASAGDGTVDAAMTEGAVTEGAVACAPDADGQSWTLT